MSDVLTPEQRKRCMSAIRGRDTKPELVVRSLLHRLGYRFRLHRKGLPGKPDIVLPRYGTVIFVHGCFWHMHACRYGRVTPRTNADLWMRKRQATVERDTRNLAALKALGMRTIVVWECETKKPDSLASLLVASLQTRRR